MSYPQTNLLTNLGQPMLRRISGNLLNEYPRFVSNYPILLHSFCGPYKSNMDLPAGTVVVHPYNPNDEEQASKESYADGTVVFPMVVSLDLAVCAELAKIVAVPHLEARIVVQTKPWGGIPLLLRPHPWMHYAAPEFSATGQSIGANVRLSAIYDPDGKQRMEFGVQGISTHTGGVQAKYLPDSEELLTPMVFSPAYFELPKETWDPATTASFHSLCTDTATGHSMLTLHILLNKKDLAIFSELAATLVQQIDLGDIVRALADKGFDIQAHNNLVTFCAGISPYAPAKAGEDLSELMVNLSIGQEKLLFSPAATAAATGASAATASADNADATDQTNGAAKLVL